MELRYASIQRPERVAYLLGARDYVSNEGLSRYIRQYDTCGDGLTQHGPAHPVCDRQQWADALASTTRALLEAIDAGRRKELADNYGCLSWPTDRADVVFALGLKYKPDKRQWYTFEDKGRRTSYTETKTYDKRWKLVPEYANGTAQAAYTLLAGHYAEDGINRMRLWLDCRDIYRQETGESSCGSLGEQWGLLRDGWHEPTRLEQAVHGFLAVARMIRDAGKAQHNLDNWTAAVARRDEPEAKAA